MSYKSYKISTFEDLINVGTTFKRNWFRGHSSLYDNLTPSMFRPNILDTIKRQADPSAEKRYYLNFMRSAPAFEKFLPKERDSLEWLFIMQHHGLPTRLLDWTENILVAAYFSVYKKSKEDGEIWTIDPFSLNDLSAIDGMPLKHNSRVQYLSDEVFWPAKELCWKHHNLPSEPVLPIALEPALAHTRITAQQSVFTLHPDNAENTIQNVMVAKNSIARFVISKELKSKILSSLFDLGVHRSSLFPDLDGLAQSVIFQGRTIAWNQPELSRLNLEEL